MIAFVQTALSYFIPFLLVLSLVVTIHELGHFWAARAFGVAIDRFSIGFGRALVSWRDRQGTIWQIGWIPLGGYVRFAGDESASSVPDKVHLDELRAAIVDRHGEEAVRSFFHFKPLWQRAIVVAAGPAANFVLAILLFALLLSAVGEVTRRAVITSVAPDSAAAAAGFQPRDVVLRADGKRINSFEDLNRYVAVRGGVTINFVVERDGREVPLTATPRTVVADDGIGGTQEMGRLGIINLASASEVTRTYYSPLEAIPAGAARTWAVLETTVYYLGRLLTGQVSADQLGGPIRIAQASGAMAQAGAEGGPDFGYRLLGAAVALTGLAAVLSVSIGFMNLLPIPVLDGGHLLFYAYEAIARRPLDAAVQSVGYRVGLALLMGFMLFATWNDLQRLSVFKFLGGLFS